MSDPDSTDLDRPVRAHRGSERPWPPPEHPYETGGPLWASPSPAGALPPPSPLPAHQPPAHPLPPPGRPVAPGAKEAIILGVAGLFFCQLAAPFAVVAATKARREMKRHPGAYEGEGFALAGLVTGWIGTAMLVGFALMFLVAFVGALWL